MSELEIKVKHCPVCKGTGVEIDGFDQELFCTNCNGTGHEVTIYGCG